MTETINNTAPMPVLFVGHGSPMNAIEENQFVKGFREVALSIPRPNAIICISAHWETRGTHLTGLHYPPTIHDFGGFPEALFKVQYPAPGNPALAQETQAQIKKTTVCLDDTWGLDHGAWTVLKHMYPQADIPLIQMSLDYFQSPAFHYELAHELSFLRTKGVLVIGSGNMVHNLNYVAWNKLNDENYGYDWAWEAIDKMKKLIIDNDHEQLIHYNTLGKAFQLSVPTPEHYLPLLYALALKKENEPIQFFNDKAVGGSLMMTSVKIG
jgi:4,5-DOPA dioxygenase extradiol